MVEQRTVLLGITGGIAVYKAAELLRLMQKAGIDVRVLMTEAATHFMGPLTFETLSGHRVPLDSDWLRADSRITHIEEGNEAQLMLVAPATANTLAKMALGIADNLLTSVYLAFPGTVVVAPAMNANMWAHPATQANLRLLRERGVHVVDPGVGELACGVYGAGRMAEPPAILAAVQMLLAPRAHAGLAGVHVVVTAGGTREAIDAVRYISNASSGKMGFALARAAAERGATVQLVAANTSLDAGPGVEVVAAPSAADMHREVMRLLPSAHVLIMAAAVADYRPRGGGVDGKMGKKQEELILRLEPTTDILLDVALHKQDQVVVGFAAEFGLDGIARARTKLERKKLDLIVFNDISRTDIGFDSDFNEVHLLSTTSESRVARAGKEEIAGAILDQVAGLLAAKGGKRG
jgi:phosphopantothenoylcysteine decarboxylase / phosphopantothenate---cysteine ligase